MQLGVASVSYDQATHQIMLTGEWNIATLPILASDLKSIHWPKEDSITFNGEQLSALDTAGAWLITQTEHTLIQKNIHVKLVGFNKQAETLLNLIKTQSTALYQKRKPLSFLVCLGRVTLTSSRQLLAYFDFIGQLAISAIQLITSPKTCRMNACATVIIRAGFDALAIIGLLSMMIGVVLTYQMGLQLKHYGANIYIVDLLGLSVLREFGPLITAIMVAGRTGSAFTAQLGMMKINQEIDALRTMGVSLNQLLMLPRILGLVIALPLLTVWADMFGIIGGMLMSKNMLHIGWHDFLNRFSHVIPLKSLIIGVGKTPVFALIIASIGCFLGINVADTADSVGRNTTRSVVLSIFFIIIADAVFSIIFSELKM